MSNSAATVELPLAHPATRWTQLGLGLICMMAISSPQYVWTLFTKPLGGALAAAPAALQVTFSLLIGRRRLRDGRHRHTFPIANALARSGYQATLLEFGLVFGAVGFIAALGLKTPPSAGSDAPTDVHTPTATMLNTPIFWLMLVMMSLMSTSGLMVTSQMATFGADFGITQAVVFGMAALPLALTVDRFTNGLTRPFFGWVSDRIGRENTMCIAFALEGVAMTLWLVTRGDPLLFVLLSGLVFFGWGEIFSLFPSTLTDTFGTRNATRNYEYLYIAQGIGAIFGGPLASLLHDATGSWVSVAIAADLTTAVLAIAVLKSLRAGYLRTR